MRIVLLLLVWASVAGAAESVVTDRAVRYVNEQVITLGDVRQRAREHYQELIERRQAVPETDDEKMTLLTQALDELTDEAVLIQYFDELGYHMPTDAIATHVLENARITGRNWGLVAQSHERKRVERQQKLRAVLSWFDDRTDLVRPAALWDDYALHQVDFRRPARCRVRQILMRATDAQSRDELRKQQNDLFNRAGESDDQKLKALVEQRKDAYVDAADLAAKDQIMLQALRDIADLSAADAAPAVKTAAKEAAQLVALADKCCDRAQCRQALEDLRVQLAGKGVDAFAEAARRLSQGPRASEGGDLEWKEVADLPLTFADQISQLAPGDLSPVFALNATGDVLVLLLLEGKEPVTQRTFPEVSGEIDRSAGRRREEAIRRHAVGILRGRASIRDLVDLQEALK